MIVSIKLKGGLGNQLFQLFTCLNYSLENNKRMILSRKKLELLSIIDNFSERPVYWDSFLSEFKKYILDDEEYTKEENNIKLLYEENPFYETIPYTPENLMLSGYFQSNKYFENQKDTIFSMLNLNYYKNLILSKVNIKNDVTYISIHFRIGDYKKVQYYHPILNINYYINSLDFIIKKIRVKNIHVICFGEKQDIPIVMNNICISLNSNLFE